MNTGKKTSGATTGTADQGTDAQTPRPAKPAPAKPFWVKRISWEPVVFGLILFWILGGFSWAADKIGSTDLLLPIIFGILLPIAYMVIMALDPEKQPWMKSFQSGFGVSTGLVTLLFGSLYFISPAIFAAVVFDPFSGFFWDLSGSFIALVIAAIVALGVLSVKVEWAMRWSRKWASWLAMLMIVLSVIQMGDAVFNKGGISQWMSAHIESSVERAVVENLKGTDRTARLAQARSAIEGCAELAREGRLADCSVDLEAEQKKISAILAEGSEHDDDPAPASALFDRFIEWWNEEEYVIHYTPSPLGGQEEFTILSGQPLTIDYDAPFRDMVVMSGQCQFEHLDRRGNILSFEYPKDSRQFVKRAVASQTKPLERYLAYFGELRVTAVAGESCTLLASFSSQM